MFKNFKFENLQILTLLDQTHQNTTKVYLAKFNQQLVVCKSIQKDYLKDSKKFQHLKNQKQALQYFTHQKYTHINRLLHAFSDQNSYYLLITPAFGLPLHKLIQMSGCFQPKTIPLIVTQVGWILRDMHNNGFIYRDTKLSNFIIDQNGKIMMIDLGLSKRIKKQRTKTVCGTTHAMPPEVFNQNNKIGYSYQFDFYGFGILIYELYVGKPPFGYQNINQNIKNDILNGITNEMMELVNDMDAKDLVRKLLDSGEKRLGTMGGFEQILEHKYFKKQNLNSIKLIFDGKGQDQILAYDFQNHRQQIEDFGIYANRYDQICPDDPFFKFN